MNKASHLISSRSDKFCWITCCFTCKNHVFRTQYTTVIWSVIEVKNRSNIFHTVCIFYASSMTVPTKYNKEYDKFIIIKSEMKISITFLIYMFINPFLWTLYNLYLIMMTYPFGQLPCCLKYIIWPKGVFILLSYVLINGWGQVGNTSHLTSIKYFLFLFISYI
jgi:hypothetical protein